MEPLKGLIALSKAYLTESFRSKTALFWNLAFPLFFLFGFAIIMGGSDPERVTFILPGLLTITIISGSFFGISMNMVMQRETGIYRRMRATPVSALTVVLAHSITSFVNLFMSLVLQLIIAGLVFKITVRGSIPELLVGMCFSIFAFIPLGLIIGSSARDTKTAPAITNLLFFPMMFLSGATFPFFMLPGWLQRVAEFLPATYVVELLQGIIYRGLPLSELLPPALILVVTGVVAFFLNSLLFRWESTEPLRKDRLAYSVGTLVGVYFVAFMLSPQFKMATPIEKHEPVAEKGQPGKIVLQGATVYNGLGRRLEKAVVVIEGSTITAVTQDTAGLDLSNARVIDVSGRYIIPGLIDSHVHIMGSAGGNASPREYQPERIVRDLQVYLGVGVTSFVSLTDDVDDLVDLRAEVAAGKMRSPRPFFAGASITAPDGHPASRFKFVPGLAERMTRQVTTAEEARQAVEELKQKGVDLIKMVLEEGFLNFKLPRLNEEALRAGIATAHRLGLKVTVHVDTDRNARLAVMAGADGLEHVPPDLSDSTIALMRERGVTLTPTLAVYEGLKKVALNENVEDDLVRRWCDPEVLMSLQSPISWIAQARRSKDYVIHMKNLYQRGIEAARRAWQGGVTIICGSDAGNPATFHGIGLIREMEIYIEKVGMPAGEVLRSATSLPADRLGQSHLGRVAPGATADLVILQSDPMKDARAFRTVTMVFVNGKPIDRDHLLDTSPGSWQPGRHLFSNSGTK